MIDVLAPRAAPQSRPRVPQALTQAVAVAVVGFVVTGGAEALLQRAFRPTLVELDWVSDVLLSMALGVATYLWLHLRATREALTARERSQLVLQTQLSLAESMQRRLLPSVPPSEHGLAWAAELAPALRIGGDFYDFVGVAPGVTLVLVADVSGKGIAAAMALTLLRSTFRSLARETSAPAELARRLSAALYEEWHGTPYVTALIARVDATARQLTSANAGHPRGLVIGRTGVRALSAGGPPMGLLAEAHFVDEPIALQDDDVCVLVTDGVSEALETTGTPWHEAVVTAVRSLTTCTAEAACRAVVTLAADGTGPDGVADWADDRTVVVAAIASAA